MTKLAIHFWQFGLSSDEHLEYVDNFNLPALRDRFPFANNAVSGVFSLSISETFYNLEKPGSASVRQPMVHSEQKTVAVMRHIPQKISKNCGKDLDPCMETCATAKTPHRET